MTATSPAQSKRKIYYGWWVLGVSVAGAFFGAVTSQLFTGAMLPDIQEGTGWSRSSITVGVTMGSMSAGFISPIFGRLADRHGARALTAVGLVVTAAALYLIALSSTIHIFVFYAGFVIARSFSSNTLNGVVPRTTAVNWFRRKRGRALGMLSTAIPLGGAAFVPIAKAISGAHGWETVYYVFGAVMVVLLLPPVLLVLRRRPEDMGLLPDGDAEAAAPTREVSREQQQDEGYTWTVRQATRTPTFWMLVAAMSFGTFGNGGIGFHQAAYFQDQGIAAAAIALAISSYALSGAFANALWGFLVERISERLLGTVTLLVASLLPFYLLTVDSAVGAVTFAVLFGLAARGEGQIVVLILARYFGRGSFGAISGFAAPFQQGALGLGPIVAALIYDLAGDSYTIAFLLFGAAFAAAATLLWTAPRPTPPAARQPVATG